MIANLRETTQQNGEQDWLKTNLARISGLMQGQRDLETVSRLIMSELTPLGRRAARRVLPGRARTADDERAELQLIASYGYKRAQGASRTASRRARALVGQAALEKKPILITDAPERLHQVASGPRRGAAGQHHRPAGPVRGPGAGGDRARLVPAVQRDPPEFLDQLMETIGVVLNTIIANMRTEELLEQSQPLTQELQSQSEELQSQQEELKQLERASSRSRRSR